METRTYLCDELVSDVEFNTSKARSPVKDRVRNVNLILDHSAFVKGIGNIKRWFNHDYVYSNLDKGSYEDIYLNIYVPTYALHEFDFVKKGPSMMATNAREAIKFIDKHCGNNFTLSFHNEDEGSQLIHYNLQIESPMEAGPTWSKCLSYKIHSPKVKEFPNYNTSFKSNLMGQGGRNSNLVSDMQSLGLSSEVDGDPKNSEPNSRSSLREQCSEEAAIMPSRLKYLIRSCVYKAIESDSVFEDPAEQWKLVCEDAITRIWASSFGIDSLNVNEAELLLFHSHDISEYKTRSPEKDFRIHSDNFASNNILQKTIDTSIYTYKALDYKKTSRRGHRKNGHHHTKNSKARQKKEKNESSRSTNEGTNTKTASSPSNFDKNEESLVEDKSSSMVTSSFHSNILRKEGFNDINYAPRGKGELWEP